MDWKQLNHNQNESVSKTKLLGANINEIIWRLKIYKSQAGNQKISEIVMSLTHSEYWLMTNKCIILIKLPP